MAKDKGVLPAEDNSFSFDRRVVRHSPNMVIGEYSYKDLFIFQRLQRDYLWYVTYNNHLIAFGQYRHDLEQWIDVTYYNHGELIKD